VSAIIGSINTESTTGSWSPLFIDDERAVSVEATGVRLKLASALMSSGSSALAARGTRHAARQWRLVAPTERRH
jgi:hypothetical protein